MKRDKHGRFKKEFKFEFLHLSIIILVALHIIWLFNQKKVEDYMKEAYSRGYATYVNGKLEWIQEKKAIIP